MNRSLVEGIKRHGIKSWQIGLTAMAVLCGCFAAAQQQQPPQQQGQSLADIARQARAQKQAQPHSDSEAQQFADELAEDQVDNGAPGGFKTYNAGDYKVWVPAPYHQEGHDSSGLVLSGPMAGTRHLVVILGNPVLAHFEDNDAAFHDAALQFVHLYADQANCSKSTVANHPAVECSMAVASVLGQRMTGNAVFIRSLGSVYPLFCVTPSDSRTRDFINSTNNTHWKSNAQQNFEKEDADIKSTLQGCSTFFQSIRIPEGISAQKSAAVVSGNVAPPVAGANPVNPAAVANTPAAPAVGAAQSAPAAPVSAIAAVASPTPSGPRAQPFVYCRSARECWNASVMVPAEAQLVSSDCKQFVFEMKIKGDPFLLLAGPSNGCDGQAATNASVVRWKQLVATENERAPGTSSTISAQQLTLDGKTTMITQMSFKKGLADWIAKRAEVDTNGTQVVVGCMSPKDRFPDGDAICTSLIESLRMP